MIAIDGSIRTALFGNVGSVALQVSPGNLFTALLLKSIFLAAVSNSMAEMAICMPANGAWSSMGECGVDEMVESDANFLQVLNGLKKCLVPCLHGTLPYMKLC
jgi:amino acid permease